MSTPLVDPQLEAFNASDPALFLAGGPTPIEEQISHAGRDLAVAIVVITALIAADLLLARPANPDQAHRLVKSLWAKHAPTWVRLAVPAIEQTYILGQISDVGPEELHVMATEYAAGLGDYLNDSSADVLVEGFSAQLNSRWNEGVAWTRASTAYGVDRQSMRSFLAAASAGDTSSDIVPPAARLLVDKALLRRADTLGVQESFSALQSGKTIAWMYLQQSGQLGPDAMREWVTRHTERTCGTCAPLDRQQVGLNEPFVMSDGSTIWAPRAHPGCLCTVKLVDDFIAKAEELRDAAGRWTRASTAVLDKPEPVTEEKVQAAPVGFNAPAPAATGFATPQGFNAPATTGFATTTGFNAPVATGFAVAATTATTATTRLGARLRVSLHIPTHTPPPPGHRGRGAAAPFYVSRADFVRAIGGDIDTPQGRANWVSDTSAYKHLTWHATNSEDQHELLDFSDLSHPDQGPVMAFQEDDPLDALSNIGPAASDAVMSVWPQALPLMVAARTEALDPVNGVVGRLTPVDLKRILHLAGYEGHSPDLARGLVATAAFSDHHGDDGLRDAFADYATLERPDLLGGPGYALRSALQVAGLSTADLAAHQQLVVLDQGLVPGTKEGTSATGAGMAELDGGYIVDGVRYHSALGLMGRHTPAGLVGWSEASVRPADHEALGAAHADEDDDFDIDPDERHPFDR